MSQTLRPGRVQPIHKKARKLPFPLNIYQTAVGKKWVMALTGIGLLGFVLVHMIGNLHMYEGPNQVNQYAESLRELGGHLAPRTLVLWIMRLGLIGMFALHIHAAVTLTRMNQTSNSKYQSARDYAAVNFASRSMRWTGLIVLAYIIFHLLDLTLGVANPDFHRHDVYGNIVASLDRPVVAIFYIIANALLAVHLYHGAWSLFQSLGVNSPRYNVARRIFAIAFASIIGIVNVSFPIMVLAGVVSNK